MERTKVVIPAVVDIIRVITGTARWEGGTEEERELESKEGNGRTAAPEGEAVGDAVGDEVQGPEEKVIRPASTSD